MRRNTLKKKTTRRKTQKHRKRLSRKGKGGGVGMSRITREIKLTNDEIKRVMRYLVENSEEKISKKTRQLVSEELQNMTYVKNKQSAFNTYILPDIFSQAIDYVDEMLKYGELPE